MWLEEAGGLRANGWLVRSGFLGWLRVQKDRRKGHGKGDGREKEGVAARSSKAGRCPYIYIFGGEEISLRTCVLITKNDGETQASNLSLRCLGLSDRKHENCKTRLFVFFFGGRGSWPCWLNMVRVYPQCYAGDGGSGTLGMKLISQPSKGKEKGSHCTSAVVSVMVLNFSPCGVARSGRDQEAVRTRASSLRLFCYQDDGNEALLVPVSSHCPFVSPPDWLEGEEGDALPCSILMHCH